jgi:hypothetical protein
MDPDPRSSIEIELMNGRWRCIFLALGRQHDGSVVHNKNREE